MGPERGDTSTEWWWKTHTDNQQQKQRGTFSTHVLFYPSWRWAVVAECRSAWRMYIINQTLAGIQLLSVLSSLSVFWFSGWMGVVGGVEECRVWTVMEPGSACVLLFWGQWVLCGKYTEIYCSKMYRQAHFYAYTPTSPTPCYQSLPPSLSFVLTLAF